MDAGRYGPNCLQPTARGHTSEDCLFLNIWTPQVNIMDIRELKTLLFVTRTMIAHVVNNFDYSMPTFKELSSLL